MDWFLLAIVLLAIALAWPVPLLLARAQWPDRSPRAALVIWQAVALGGALSMFGALLGIAFWPGVTIPELFAHPWLGPLPAQWSLVNALAFAALLLFAALLGANLLHAVWVTERKRRQHRSRVELLSAPLGDFEHVRLLNHPAPLAFCLPGVRNLTVLSSGLVELFTEDEFVAVLAHERAHLRGQHHLMLLAFRAWHDALPWFPMASRAEGAVAHLIELVADDEAARAVNRAWLASALERIGGAWDDGLSFGQHSGFTTQASYQPRLARLQAPRDRISPVARWAALAGAMLLVFVPAAYLALELARAG